MEDSLNTDEMLTRVTGYVEEWEEDTRTSRARSEKCRDYYDHEQYTDEEKEVLAARKQPITVNNRIKKKVDFLLGMKEKTKADPKAYPRTPAHKDDSEAATDSIRYVCDNSGFDDVQLEVFENLAIEGSGAVNVFVKPKGRDFNIVPSHIPWDRFVYDPKSRQKNYDDAKFMGEMLWMDEEDAKDKWPDSEQTITASYSNDATDETLEDKPKFSWGDARRKRVRVCLMYFLYGGKWHYCVFVKGGFIEAPALSAYLDEDDEPACGILAQSVYVSRSNDRYGSVYTWLDLQDEVNKRHSKGLHLISVNQTWSKSGVMDKKQIDKFRSEKAKPDGHLEFPNVGEFGKDFGVIDNQGEAAANFNLLQIAKEEIDSQGVNAAMAGADERNMSGRALDRRKESGQVELGPLFKASRSLEFRVYRAIWNRIQQFWTEQKWVRVTDDEKGFKFVGINQPITLGQQITEQYGEIPPQFRNDPRLNEVVGHANQIGELDVDIIIEDAPDTITIQSEEFEKLVNMYQANPNGIPWEMVIQASNLRNKDKLLEQFDQQGEQAGQTQQQAAKLQQAKEMAEAKKDETSANLNQAKADQINIENQFNSRMIG